ncbi:hypothetical protein GALMADRAFT_237561 [Galerina marginata CBS 339.88]|uniref:Uncharacterized protein n=1 Tax=Galerina marginata (strain CBS 339.88) TaxID=685588 RepID=A0A067TGP4_GALM3|nr:hypothetical protein GALMADRAFT_237561 [Galerina marginata CBS 339.88]
MRLHILQVLGNLGLTRICLTQTIGPDIDKASIDLMAKKLKSATLCASNDYLNPSISLSLLSSKLPSSCFPPLSGSGQAWAILSPYLPNASLSTAVRHQHTSKVYCAANAVHASARAMTPAILVHHLSKSLHPSPIAVWQSSCSLIWRGRGVFR